MILSKKFGFLFVKLGKIGGSSLEIALSKYLGEDDIITPINEKADGLRASLGFRGPQNFEVRCCADLRSYGYVKFARHYMVRSLSNLKHFARSAIYKKKFAARSSRAVRLYHHVPAQEVKGIIGQSIYDSLFKFTIVRNPWDWIVSRYYDVHRTEESRDHNPFRDWVKTEAPAFFEKQWSRYTNEDRIIVDRCLRYEELSAELSEIAFRLGLPDGLLSTLQGLHVHGDYRKGRDLSWMDRQSRDTIRYAADKIIRAHGYEEPR